MVFCPENFSFERNNLRRVKSKNDFWRGGRVVECGSVENCYTRKRIGSSNLPLSDGFYMTIKRKLIVFCFCLFLTPFAFPSFLRAEIIQLKNGNAMETKILREDDEFVTVEAVGGKVKIPKRDISKIWRGSKEELVEISAKRVFFTKGMELYKDGRFRESAESFKQSLGPAAGNAIIYANLGSAYASAGEFQKAETSFLESLKQKPDHPDILLNLARLYEAQKEYQKAVFYYLKTLNRSATDMSAQRSLAYCYYMNGDYLKAAETFGVLGEKNDIVSRCNSAAAYIQAGELDRAEAILNEMAEDPFPVPRVYLNMGNLCFLKGDLVRAEQYYRQGLQRDPKTAEIHQMLGDLYLRLEQPEMARQHFKEVLEKDPKNGWAMAGLAQALIKAEEFEKAGDLCHQLAREHAGDSRVLNRVGLMYLKIGKPALALEIFNTLIARDEKDARAHSNAGLAYVMRNDADNALKAWTRALELEPGLESALQNKKLLEEALSGESMDVQ